MTVSLSARGIPAGGSRAESMSNGRVRVREIQRTRIITAMTELVRERGPAGVTVAHVVARSGVSRRTFYELFEDREDCLLAAFDRAIAAAAETVLPAYEAQGNRGALGCKGSGRRVPGSGPSARKVPKGGAPRGGVPGRWREQIRAALRAALEFLDGEPQMGYLCVVGSLGGGQRALERRAVIVQGLVDVVHEGRLEGRGARRVDRLVAEGVVGAVLAVIHTRLLEPSPRPLVGLLNPLMGMVVLPYLGPAAAERELVRATPRPARRPEPRTDPLRDLDMRLTYRTVRVLLAIAAEPAASNRQVATAAGISDQGQISKLLTRLQNLGLIHNSGGDHARGEPNAWMLTLKGQQVTHTLQAQATR